MRLVWTIVVVALVSAGVAAQDPRLSFLKGNEAMDRQDWEEAAAAYEAVLASVVESAEVHFNLANASFRAGRLGPAIQHYLRARTLLPRKSCSSQASTPNSRRADWVAVRSNMARLAVGNVRRRRPCPQYERGQMRSS